MTFDEFIDQCEQGGLYRAKHLLRKYIEDGQPEGFCGEATTRAMCREASNAITGHKYEHYMDTVHGTDLYFHMWGIT